MVLRRSQTRTESCILDVQFSWVYSDPYMWVNYVERFAIKVGGYFGVESVAWTIVIIRNTPKLLMVIFKHIENF